MKRTGTAPHWFVGQEWFQKMDPYTSLVWQNECAHLNTEVNKWDLFDRLTLPASDGTGSHRRAYFFHRSMGSAVHGSIDTSMQVQGTGNRTFIVESLGFMVPKKERKAWERIAPWAACELRISAKIYRHMPAAIVPVYNMGDPIYRKVTREMRTPGKAWTQVTVEESKPPLLKFDPFPVILPYRPFELMLEYVDQPMILPFHIMAVLTGWDLRQAL